LINHPIIGKMSQKPTVEKLSIEQVLLAMDKMSFAEKKNFATAVAAKAGALLRFPPSVAVPAKQAPGNKTDGQPKGKAKPSGPSPKAVNSSPEMKEKKKQLDEIVQALKAVSSEEEKAPLLSRKAEVLREMHRIKAGGEPASNPKNPPAKAEGGSSVPSGPEGKSEGTA
jgi:hypothetical protein